MSAKHKQSREVRSLHNRPIIRVVCHLNQSCSRRSSTILLTLNNIVRARALISRSEWKLDFENSLRAVDFVDRRRRALDSDVLASNLASVGDAYGAIGLAFRSVLALCHSGFMGN